ncbi:MAG: LamG-like jellyroll fold domain-containing protein, partial [Gelidibacter sp.]
QTVCSPGDPATLTSSIAASGGIGTRSYQWQMNTLDCDAPEASWIPITGATGANYNPPAGLLVTTHYRRLAQYTTGACSEASNCVTVYVNNVTGGAIAGDQTICTTNPDAFTQTTASSGSGTLTYQWQLSTASSSGPWTPIPGQTLITYDPPVGVTTTTYYKRVTTSTLNGQACPADSNVLTVTPSDLTAGIIIGNRVLCSVDDIPTDLVFNTPATGSGTLTYQWQSRVAPGSWTDIMGATSVDYTFTAGITNTTDYRRIVTSSIMGCEGISGFITVFVNATTAPVISGDETVCSTDDPVAFTVTTTATGSGALTYQWQQSTNTSGPWTNINLATSATYNPPVLATTTYYQVVVTSRLNSVNCSSISNILTVTVNPFTPAVASGGTPANCSDTTIPLTANGIGTWSAVPRTTGALYSFSDNNDVTATFTGESGVTYDITWTITNLSPCDPSSATFALVFPPCAAEIDFNGTNNYTNFNDQFDFTTDFSIELWIKRNNTSATTQTMISKRDAADLTTGYDLGLNNGRLTFNWDATGTLQTTQTLGDSRWYHVAVTHTSGTYRLYIDGIEVSEAAGERPTPNAFNALLGAKGRVANVPQDYYNGSMDEVRIWDKGLSEAQIREMMNQEIEANGSAVRGSILKLDIDGLSWSDLKGYYRMNQGTSDITAGALADNSGSGHAGVLANMNSMQLETAPLPYVSQNNGNWTASSTWLNGSVQQIPNTDGINGTPIDWNIVRTAHNVVASGGDDITLLGLLVDNNTLSIQHTNPDDGQALTVTKYLNIDAGAVLDLVGESQLLQPEGSIVGTGTGILERDQEGTGNMFNYNYWGSPVSTDGTLGARTYDLKRAINDGIDQINWIPSHTFPPTSSPVSISTRWLYTYKGDDGAYDVWKRITPDSPIDVGVGFTMKGSGINTATDKNYTFKGQPNNGTIIVNIGGSKQAVVIGNPYPSAIDADQFIDDNQGALLNGTLQFWQQSPNAATHVLAQYQGGYGYLTKSGGLAPVSPPEIAGIGNATTAPERFIPVGQGFYVTGSSSGGNITFKNSQRVFVKESSGTSVFLRTPEGESKTIQSSNDALYVDDIQRVRLAFKTPEGAKRNLLLAFTPDDAATDGIDYGYDARNGDEFPSDLLFAIEGEKFVIQGVGAFDINKKYPLDMMLGITGNVELALTELENFDASIDVYLRDAFLDTYTRINDVNFQLQLEKGNYKDRFSLVFKPDATLSTIDQDFKEIQVKYLQKTDEIYVKTPASIEVRQVYLINMAGQAVKSWNMTNMNFGQEFKIPVKNISEGNYILKVETSTNSYNKKMVIKFK